MTQGVCKSLLVFHCRPIYVYLVPFLRYSTFNNGVTLKYGLVVVQGHWKWRRFNTQCATSYWSAIGSITDHASQENNMIKWS